MPSSSLLVGWLLPPGQPRALWLFLPGRPVGSHKPAWILATLPSPAEALRSGQWSPMACSDTASACARPTSSASDRPVSCECPSGGVARSSLWTPHLLQKACLTKGFEHGHHGPRGPLPSTLTRTLTPSPDPKRNANGLTLIQDRPPGASWTRGRSVCGWGLLLSTQVLIGCWPLISQRGLVQTPHVGWGSERDLKACSQAQGLAARPELEVQRKPD